MKKGFDNSLIIGLALTLGVAVAAFVLSLGFVVIDAGGGDFSRLPSHSMEPTLLDGDYITSRRLPRDARNLRLSRGDIVVFLWPEDTTKQFVKRLIGLPGDTIEMRDAVMLVDGHRLSEPYAVRLDSVDPVSDDFRWQRGFVVGPAARDTLHYVASRATWGPLVVPPMQFFVLGDRRDASLDSRYFGFVPVSKMIGRVRRVYFSRDDSTGVVRWSRIGHLVR